MDPNSENRLIRALEEVAYELRSKRAVAGEPTWAPEHVGAMGNATVWRSDVEKVATLLQTDVNYLNSSPGTAVPGAQQRAEGYRRALYLIETWTGVRP